MKAQRPQLLAAFFTLTCWVGCTQANSQPTVEAPDQPQPSPMAPRPEPPQCTSDADCTDGMVCAATIHAACDTCDGGKVINVCRQPPA